MQNTIVSGSTAGGVLGVIMALESGSVNRASMQRNFTHAETGFVFGQNQGTNTSFDPKRVPPDVRFWPEHNSRNSLTLAVSESAIDSTIWAVAF